jgi:hypothetical protein
MSLPFRWTKLVAGVDMIDASPYEKTVLLEVVRIPTDPSP